MRAVKLQVAALATLAVLALGTHAPPARATPLQTGDIVMIARDGGSQYVYRVDPLTLARTPLSSGGLLTSARQIAVGDGGMIYVTDPASGVVAIDPADGAQSVLVGPAALGGRQAYGICRAGAGALYVTAANLYGGNPAVLRVGVAEGAVQVLATNGPLQLPNAITMGPDGFAYIAEGAKPPDISGVYPNYRGSIVRFDPTTLDLTVVQVEPMLLIGPIDIAVTPAGDVWTAQWGNVSRRLGYFVRTRLADGYSEVLGSAYQRSQGVAIGLDGTIFMGDCQTIGPDCYYTFMFEFPYGDYQLGPAGDMDVVPDDITPVRQTRWGTLKAIYR